MDNPLKNTLTDTILLEGEKEAAEMLRLAAEAAEKEISEARAAGEALLATTQAEAEKEGAELIEKRETLARLEVKKRLLSAKQDVLSGVYRRALGKLSSLSENQYLELLQNLIVRYAEEGERVVFAADCPIQREKLERLAVIKERRLTPVFGGKFRGGLKIEGISCDKDLSFDALVASVREETEAEISAALFAAESKEPSVNANEDRPVGTH